MSELATLPQYDLGALDSEEALQDFQKYGCLQISNYLPMSVIERLRAGVEQSYESCIRTGNFVTVGNKRKMITVPIRDEFADPTVHSPTALRTSLKALLGEDYVLNCYSCVISHPGAQPQHTHTDYPGLFGSGLDCLAPSYAINLFIPLVELNETNGTTEMWPGTHRKPLGTPEQHNGVRPKVTPGSAILMDYRVQHRGTANISTAPRPILTLAYSRGWFFDTRNFKSAPPLNLERARYEQMCTANQALFERAKLYF